MNIEELNGNKKFYLKMEKLICTFGIVNNGSVKRVGQEPEFSYKGENFYINNSLHPMVMQLIDMYIRKQLFYLYDDL